LLVQGVVIKYWYGLNGLGCICCLFPNQWYFTRTSQSCIICLVGAGAVFYHIKIPIVGITNRAFLLLNKLNLPKIPKLVLNPNENPCPS
jgi:hypothetical protein